MVIETPKKTEYREVATKGILICQEHFTNCTDERKKVESLHVFVPENRVLFSIVNRFATR